MATGREKRTTAGAKMKDILKELTTGRTVSDGESDDDYQESFSAEGGHDAQQVEQSQQHQQNAEVTVTVNESVVENENVALEKQLAEVKLAVLKQKIANGKRELLQLQQREKQQGSASGSTSGHVFTTPTTAVTEYGDRTEPRSDTAGECLVLTEPSSKALKIVDFLWQEPVPQYDTVSLGNNVEFRIGKNKTLDKVTIEQWGYANTKIMESLLKSKELSDPKPYLKYTADIFRLASKHVWFTVLLYDKEYRESQAAEGFTWGTYRQDLRDFNLILKQNNPTTKALGEATGHVPTASGNQTFGKNHVNKSTNRRRGPFTTSGQEICRNYNNDGCSRVGCRMIHCCALCMSPSHSAQQHGQNSLPQPKNDQK